jgi:uncharacterized membrane protein YqjE
MTDGNGIKPPQDAEKSLGEVVGDVTSKLSLLVQEEIELAKAEVSDKVSKLGKGAAAGAAAGIFLVFMLIYLMHGLAWLFVDLLDEEVWVGYFIVTGLLLFLGGIAGLIAMRMFKRGAPPTPDLAIEEAKRTREALEEARH